MEQRWIQRWKDIMAACFKSGANDATGTKVANQILSSIPRGLARKKYRKILKMNHGAYIFHYHGGKFAFQNRLGWPYSWKEIYRFCFVLLCI